MKALIAFVVLCLFTVTAHAAPHKAGCKCDSDPRGCPCAPTGAHQKHNYPCGDEACPWAHLTAAKKAAPCRSCEAAGYDANGRKVARQPARAPVRSSCGPGGCSRPARRVFRFRLFGRR